jgi:hypothetical protein
MLRQVLLACAVSIVTAPPALADTSPAVAPPLATAAVTVQTAPPEPRPALKSPRRGVFPMKPWSYAKGYTYNFFESRPVPMRVLSEDGAWSPHIRTEQVISEAIARRAAELVAKTQGSIETTKCTFPRHAIVYFDREDKPVATVDVCFDCEAVLARPDYARPENYDWARAEKRLAKALPKWRELFEELGMPIDYKTAPTAQ